MRLRAVQSEMLDLVGYDAKSQVLEVRFNTGDRYRYLDVPPDEYEGLMSAESIGKYMRTHIIDHYEYERIN